MDHCRVLLSHEMRVEQSLHLLRVHVILVHVLTKLAGVGLKQNHSSVVHLHVHVIVHNRSACVPVIDVLVHNPLLLSHLSDCVPVLQSHVSESREGLLCHRGSIGRFLLSGRESLKLCALLRLHTSHLLTVNLVKARQMLRHSSLLLPLMA